MLAVSILGDYVVDYYYFEKLTSLWSHRGKERTTKSPPIRITKQSVEKLASFRKDEPPQYVRRPFLELEVTRNQAECSKNKQPKNRKKNTQAKIMRNRGWTFVAIMDWGSGGGSKLPLRLLPSLRNIK